MSVQEKVGGRLRYRRGPEETHRPATTLFPLGRHVARGLVDRLARLASARRFRVQIAGLAALGLIALIIFLLPARTVRIVVDGAVTTVESRSSSEVAIVEQAGIELRPGDRVERVGDGALAVRRAAEAIVEVDGATLSVRAQADTIVELLAQVGIVVGPRDSVLRDGVFVSPDAALPGAPTAEAPITLTVRRAVPFRVVENGHALELRSSRETVATALRDAGVRLGPGDQVQPPPGTELTAGLELHIHHAVPIVVTLPDEKLVVYSLARTAGEAVVEGGLDLPPRYRLEPGAETLVTPDLAIHVIGISEEQELEQERIESRTVYQPDASLPWGASRVVPGQDGMYFRQYRVVYENDQLASRELEAEWYDPEPADSVIYYSAAEPALAAPPRSSLQDVPEGLNVAQVLPVYATWYNPASTGRSPADPSYGITATGVAVTWGVVAVDPSVVPLGTRLYIPGYGYGVAADTGGGIRGDMIDLGYPDGVVSDWTSRWIEIYILGP